MKTVINLELANYKNLSFLLCMPFNKKGHSFSFKRK